MPLIVRCFVKLIIEPKGTGKNAATVYNLSDSPSAFRVTFLCTFCRFVPFGRTYTKKTPPKGGSN